jgi:predicted PurR-regulated permease PerM
MSISKQYLEQIRQTASQLSEIANNMQQDAIRLIQQNPQINGRFQDQNIANDISFTILCSVNLQKIAENMMTYCEERLSNMQ